VSDHVIELLIELQTDAKRFAAVYAPPRVAPGRFTASPKFAEKLTAALSEIAIFSERPGLNFFSMSMTAPINTGSFASALIERVIDGADPSKALDDLKCFVSKKSCDVYVLMAVDGVDMPFNVELEDGVTLMPARNTPATLARETLFDLDRQGKIIFRGTVVSRRVTPTAALLVKFHTTVIGTGERDQREFKTLTDEILLKRDHVMAALTLSGADCAPYVASETSWIDHPAYPYSGFGYLGCGTHVVLPPLKKIHVDGPATKALYQKIKTTPDADRTIIMRAIGRLGRSRSHVLPVDRAIDLGIATEMIFLHDQNDQGELRFRTALRAAWFLGDDRVSRRAVFDCIRKAYDARSAAVHTGKLGGQGLIENLPRADVYCADAMRRLLDAGGFPKDWNSVVLDEVRP
jgi:hypothetical protein